MKKKKEQIPVKSDLILYQTEDGKTRIEVRLQDETVWLSQKLMAELFQTTVPNINMHINNIFEEGELEAESVIKDFLITAADGKMSSQRLKHIRNKHKILLCSLTTLFYKAFKERFAKSGLYIVIS